MSNEWREQNRPWDYDHILPKNWVGDRRISNYTYLVRKFLWSIGNSAPLPFSLNRGKNASAPDNYPDRTLESADMLHVNWEEVNRFGQEKENYDRLDRNKGASERFIEATIHRMLRMIRDWHESCHIGELFTFDDCKDARRRLFEAVQNELQTNSDFSQAKISVWFAHNDRQYCIRKSMDWARPWLVCGICGTVQHEGKQRHCILGVASSGKQIQVGIRRHPDVNEMPGGEWWLQCSTYGDLAGKGADEIAQELRAKAKEYSFEPE